MFAKSNFECIAGKVKISEKVKTHIHHEDEPPMVSSEIPNLSHSRNGRRRKWQRTAIVAPLVVLLGILTVEEPQASAQSVATKTCPPLTQGFWKNHSSAWNVTSLTLGTTNYSQAQLLAILETSPSGDASLILGDQLIAAKLNIAVIGTDPTKVAATIKDADTLLGVGPIPEGVDVSSTIGQQMVNDAAILDSFNKGLVTQACLVPATSSGSTGIIPGLVNGQLVDKAYVPITFLGSVAVINIDSSTPAALIKSINMPAGYHPNATAANPVTQQVVVVSYTSPDVQIIDASQDVFVATVTSPVTRTATFSGGRCMICGALINASTNSAILDTAQGYLLLNLATRQFSSFLPGTVAGENFGFNPNTGIVLNPTYFQGVPPGLQAVNLASGSVFTYTTSVGGFPDANAIDINTNIAVVPDEFTANQHLINMAEATFDSTSFLFSAPSTVFPLTFTNCGFEAHDWSMMSAESSTHNLFLATEFADCAAVESLPSSIVSGAPRTPAVFRWGHMSSPDATPWNNGGDPHGIAVFTSVVDGKAYGFLVRFDQAWVARIDLAGLKNASLLVGGLPDQADITPFVFFLKTQ